MSDIDTTIAGSPASVDEAAAWMQGLRDSIDDASTAIYFTGMSSDEVWVGLSASAYEHLASDLGRAADETYERAKKAADVARSFADQLQWRQEDMAEHRAKATEGGLTVVGNVILRPGDAAAVPELAPDATTDERERHDQLALAHDEQVRKIELFGRLAGDARTTYSKLSTWIADNLVPAEELTLTAGLVAALAEALKLGAEGSVEWGENHYEQRSATLTGQAKAAAEAAARRASGNPAIRAGLQLPREEAVAKRLAKAGKTAAQEAAERLAKKLGILGTVLTLGFAGADLAAGESPSGVAVDVAAGVAGAAVGAAIVAGAGVIAVTVVAVIVGAGAVAAAGWVYENVVPQETREKIDEGIRDVAGGVWHALFG